MTDQILRLLELTLTLDREFIELIIVTIVGPAVGGLLGYYFSRYKTTADVLKTSSEAAKIKAETDALELTNNANTIKYYIDIITQLQAEVKLHTARFSDMDKKLTASFDEKKRLAMENEKLIITVYEQGKEIVALKEEVKALQLLSKPEENPCL
jgi:capsular polysaccharide biosynthesis protein